MMDTKTLRRLGYVVAYNLPDHTPGADEYLPDGTPVFRSRQRAQDFFDARAKDGGIRVKVDPDGGVLSPREIRQQLEARRDQQADVRRKAAEARAKRAALRSRRIRINP
jgi:hypothetical protein